MQSYSLYTLLPLLILTSLLGGAHSLTASERFYIDTTPDTPGNCKLWKGKLDDAYDEGLEMVKAALGALDLLKSPPPPDDGMAEIEWNYYFFLFIAQYYHPEEGEVLPNDDSGGLGNLGEWKEVRSVFERLEKAWEGGAEKTKQVFCSDRWLKYIRADDEDPLAPGKTMKDKWPDWYRKHPGKGKFHRQNFPPGASPTYDNAFSDKDRDGDPDSPICGPGVFAEVADDFKLGILTFCPTELAQSHATLLETLEETPIEEELDFDDADLRALSDSWVHEMMHWVEEIDLDDEVALNMLDGQPNLDENGEYLRAYGWYRTVALAHHERETALENVENHLMFAKAVYLRQLDPQWSFLLGAAAPA